MLLVPSIHRGSLVVIKQTPKQAQRRNPKRLQVRHACEDGAERALAVIDALDPEHRPGALRIVREAIDQRIGVRSSPSTPADPKAAKFARAGEQLRAGRAA